MNTSSRWDHSRGSCPCTALAHSYLDTCPLLVHPQAGHIRSSDLRSEVYKSPAVSFTDYPRMPAWRPTSPSSSATCVVAAHGYFGRLLPRSVASCKWSRSAIPVMHHLHDLGFEAAQRRSNRERELGEQSLGTPYLGTAWRTTNQAGWHSSDRNIPRNWLNRIGRHSIDGPMHFMRYLSSRFINS